MTITLEEVKEHLKSLDEITLLEKLEITSGDLVDRFEDFIEDKEDQLLEELEEERKEEEPIDD